MLEHGTPEWRNDLKLAALTILCSITLIIFFSADDLVGAVLLRAIYFRYGTLLTLVLLASVVWIVMKWANIPLIGKLIGTSAFMLVAGPFLANPDIMFFAITFSILIVPIGLICFIPAALCAWLAIGIVAWTKGRFRDYLTEPLLIKLIIICPLLLAAYYASFRHVNSLDFTTIEHETIDTQNYYSVSRTSISSDVSSGIVQYKCNAISISCSEIKGK